MAEINKCPDCLFMSIKKYGSGRARFSLAITAHFDYQVIDFFGGKLIMALRGGDLRLDLVNCELTSFLVYKDLTWSVEKSIGVTEGLRRRQQQSDARQLVLGTAPALDSKSGAEREVETHRTQQTTSSFTSRTVSAIRGPRPGWRFRTETQEKYLTGSFENTKFATFHNNPGYHKITASFEVHQKNIYIEIVESNFFRFRELDFSKKKILDIFLYRTLIKKQTIPFLSKSEV
ncbi:MULTISPECIES: hypothetical protein [unclassified Sphingopyxis]|uniref:hypothetical protein n=1 Tax=unclassified Sphingopyxis TaxID=2614943 RepID=UPI000AE5A77E|nr:MULTISPECIES: hypothetical protein [unclassified Sphingopyxis]